MRGQLLISLLPAAVLGAPAPEPTTPPSALELRAALDARGFLEARAATGPLAEWVSVISDGYANTYTPSVNVDAGKTTTLNPAPTSLLGVANPTAQDASGRGTFLVCNNKEGVGAPFCTPKNGSEVVAGKTYYLTWDTSYFADANTVVSIHGDYLDGKNEDGGKGTGQVFEGFVSEIDLRAGLGFFAWTVDPDMLGNSARRRVNLWLAIESTTGQIVQTLDGPDVFLVKGESKPKSGPNLALLVAVPVVVGLVLLAAAAVGCFFFLRRRRVLGARRRASAASSGSGYGIRKSASQRVGAGDKAGVNIMLSPTSPTGPRPGEPWGAPQMPAPPAPGQNVFREELRRQERERI